MPEGPEIRQASDRLAQVLVNRPLDSVYFAFDRLKPHEAPLTQATITDVRSRGKALLLHFSNHRTIYSHNQLYGVWYVRRAHQYPTTKRQLRLALHTDSHSALLYSASDIDVLTDSQLAEHPFLSRLGVDVLDDDTTEADVLGQLQHSSFQRRRFATLLLDQHFLCGLGNYLRSEILFVARLHPQQRPCDCTPQQQQHLAATVLAVTRQSYHTQGITNDLDIVARLQAEGVSRSRFRHWVFGRDGLPCYVCGGAIEKIVAGGRRCYVCPHCQPR